MTKRILATLFITITCGICHANSIEDSKNRAMIATVTDAVTTSLVLSHGGHDLNPLIGTSQSRIVPITLAKLALIGVLATSNLPEKEKEQSLNVITSVWAGGSINNLLVLAGAANPVSLIVGTISAFVIYDKISTTP